MSISRTPGQTFVITNCNYAANICYSTLGIVQSTFYGNDMKVDEMDIEDASTSADVRFPATSVDVCAPMPSPPCVLPTHPKPVPC